MKKYTHIFFDLDHTLWDLEKNSEEILLELYHHHQLKEKGVDDHSVFLSVYHKINRKMWDDFSKKNIRKEDLRLNRFFFTMNHFGNYDKELSELMAHDYVTKTPHKQNLIPHAMEVLNHLSASGYTLCIITNGFKETQHTKLKSSGIMAYFNKIFISEEIGFMKPEKEIFEYAMKNADAFSHQSIMIGDNPEVDIRGANNAGMDTIFYNPSDTTYDCNPTFEIKSLFALLDIL